MKRVRERRAFESGLDKKPDVRALLIQRMKKAAEQLPIALLHQYVGALEEIARPFEEEG